ncbi:MAG: efflux RND transporter periplasmic adaptor subunit [Anaerolineaceae bacterium]|nr:efflux RND transporter periplasmic adaptor subunit [Anaerolineaceae bacterium]
MKKTSKGILIGVLVGLALAVGRYESGPLLEWLKKPKEHVAQKLTNVAVQVVGARPMVDQLTIRGMTEPWTSVSLSAETSGKLVFVARDEGDRVVKGERLFGIDTAILKADLESAEARARYAAMTYQRTKKMFADEAISKDELDRTKAEMDAARATVELCRACLDDADVFSPIAGVLDSRVAEVGEFLNPGQPLGEVVDVSRIKVVMPVPEKDVRFIHVGDEVEMVIEALADGARRGKVIFVKEVADPVTLTFPVQVEVANAEGRIRPGMIAKVNLVRRRFEKAIAVNIFYVLRHEKGYRVFVEQDGLACAREVVIGIFDGQMVQIVSGLTEGDRLIVKGQRELIDGVKVKVVEQIGPDGRRVAAAASGGGDESGTAEVPVETNSP